MLSSYWLHSCVLYLEGGGSVLEFGLVDEVPGERPVSHGEHREAALLAQTDAAFSIVAE